ncbi:MAG: monovalent cation/H+ antiporter subunit D family protein [Planctomycetes bacterium]|nr:monovalent cation/H+ antiporter subunit D family protein [Planctomycetota bacterium]
MHQHLPALVVLLPFFGGLTSVLTRRGSLAWLWASIIGVGTFSATVGLLLRVLDEGVVTYAMGGWKAPWGIEYRVDAVNASVLLVVAAIGCVTTLYARRSVADEIPNDRLHFFYALWQLCQAGLLGITITGDAFNIYVMLEISSLTIYGLLALGKDKDRRALTATINYIIVGSIGASFILIAIGYLYMVTGTLNIADMSHHLGDLLQRERELGTRNATVHVAFAFLMVGLSIKMALFPLHTWLPNAYTYAPSAVTAMLAATATKVGIYMAIRFYFTIFGAEFSFEQTHNQAILMVCASLAILLGSLAAIRQQIVKRLLAYSSIAQIGYIVLGFALVNRNGLAGSIVHIANHALMKGGMFMALGAVVYSTRSNDLSSLKGLGRRMPFTMAAFTAGGLGLIGFPLTGGFISKWYLVSGTLERGLWPLAIVVLLGSLLALYYVWKLVELIYFEEPGPNAPLRDAPWSLVIPTWLLIGASIYFGIDARLTGGLAEAAAERLLGG